MVDTNMELQIRRTHKYVGPYNHLDDWDTIGSAIVIKSQTEDTQPDDDFDPCEPKKHVHLVHVEAPGASDEQIKQALLDSFDHQGCSHEYDCCGCRSYSSDEAIPHAGSVWQVIVYSSRNF